METKEKLNIKEMRTKVSEKNLSGKKEFKLPPTYLETEQENLNKITKAYNKANAISMIKDGHENIALERMRELEERVKENEFPSAKLDTFLKRLEDERRKIKLQNGLKTK